jgi:hypothetical protein
MCPDAAFSDTGTVNGVVYTKRTREEIRNNPALERHSDGIYVSTGRRLQSRSLSMVR